VAVESVPYVANFGFRGRGRRLPILPPDAVQPVLNLNTLDRRQRTFAPLRDDVLVEEFRVAYNRGKCISFDRKFCEMAVAEARKSIAETDGELHPHVGAVVVKESAILATGFRGETGAGRHAEFCALKKINDDVDRVDLSGCTVYTTLEPCSKRNSPNKAACATRLINANVSRVVFGMPDKDESVYGHVSLIEANIAVGHFPADLIQELVALNKNWSNTRRQPEIAPSPNDTSPVANASYYKPGTSMADNLHLFVRPPKNDGGFFTIEDAAKKVLFWGQTLQEIAVKWQQIDAQKRIVEGLHRHGSGSSHQLLALSQ
jgi:pyrimidine deaminase RibD-like protein